MGWATVHLGTQQPVERVLKVGLSAWRMSFLVTPSKPASKVPMTGVHRCCAGDWNPLLAGPEVMCQGASNAHLTAWAQVVPQLLLAVVCMTWLVLAAVFGIISVAPLAMPVIIAPPTVSLAYILQQHLHSGQGPERKATQGTSQPSKRCSICFSNIDGLVPAQGPRVHRLHGCRGE